jgi:hypothetical protein
MGERITCTAKVDGREDRGTALLETDYVLFRGEASRARVSFASLRSVDVKGEWLVLLHASGTLALALGARAPTWLAKIRSPKGIVEKLGIKPGARVAMVALDDAELADGLTALGAKVQNVRSARGGAPRGEVDAVIFGVEAEGDLARVAPLAAKLARDGALWIVRPKGVKGKGGVAEGAVRAAGLGAGLVDVKVARYSETHTAAKFVIPLAKR